MLTIGSSAAKDPLEMTLDLSCVSPIAGQNAMRIREILRKSTERFLRIGYRTNSDTVPKKHED